MWIICSLNAPTEHPLLSEKKTTQRLYYQWPHLFFNWWQWLFHSFGFGVVEGQLAGVRDDGGPESFLDRPLVLLLVTSSLWCLLQKNNIHVPVTFIESLTVQTDVWGVRSLTTYPRFIFVFVPENFDKSVVEKRLSTSIAR